MANITFTVLESANKQAVTKELSLNNDGSITKQSLAYNLAKGIAYTISCEFSDFIKIYEDINKHQALAYGIMKDTQKSYIASQAYIEAHKLSNIIERSNNRFHYPNQSGLLMLDIDDATMNFTQLYQILTSILPALNDAPLLHRASTSSNIYHAETGELLRDETGFRILVAVDNARAIPELGKLIYEHLWLHKHGYFAISKAGTLLECYQRCKNDPLTTE
jgi:uncharacterized protein (DUF952 family)